MSFVKQIGISNTLNFKLISLLRLYVDCYNMLKYNFRIYTCHLNIIECIYLPQVEKVIHIKNIIGCKCIIWLYISKKMYIFPLFVDMYNGNFVLTLYVYITMYIYIIIFFNHSLVNYIFVCYFKISIYLSFHLSGY